jgi:predicted nucleotide-binding protein
VNNVSELSAALAKLAGNLKAVQRILEESARYARPTTSFKPAEVQHYFVNVHAQLATLRTQRPDLYADFSDFSTQPDKPLIMPDGKTEKFFSRDQLERLTRDIEQIFEIRSNSELVTPAAAAVAAKRRVFVSHGRANDWREVQQFIEKDIGLETRELAQEPNQGRTILEKLNATANECDSAVIVMTGDDLDGDGLTRARENVIHEIGFFQGKYGLSRICLMHEEGVNIPSNIHGLVYTPFPKGTVSAAFGLLYRELKAMYR